MIDTTAHDKALDRARINRLVNALDSAGHSGAPLVLSAGDVWVLNRVAMPALLKAEADYAEPEELARVAAELDELAAEDARGRRAERGDDPC